MERLERNGGVGEAWRRGWSRVLRGMRGVGEAWSMLERYGGVGYVWRG